MTVDVLAVGAHPDDADLGVGGLLLKLAARGHRTAILDLTRGELGSRGTAEERAEEARRAGELLGLAVREQAGLPDGGVANVPAQREGVARWIRTLRPRMLLAPMTPDRHPDHEAAHGLVRDANFFAGVAGFDTGQEPHRAAAVYYYHPYHEPREAPALVVDISEYFEQKLEALRAHKSQFHNPGYEGPNTYVASRAFWERITVRAAHWGARTGVAHGEPLYCDGPLGVDLPPGIAAGK